ncbi:hypothetical protein NQ315_016121 [Exocentrus adspersus]|uniref:Saposin B-type domain-containing protein n=1 Tax=Exocentrus adspersus TaxID=1586481 RepID=A0AAV8VBV6_9CUCU|nr:hypothetical protein NQ315_016121 [Exocentrus adspersus]
MDSLSRSLGCDSSYHFTIGKSAAGCHAVRHCIQTVWVHKELPPDTSSVCQTCLDMVKQARDQLMSNETQDLIKQVFEGSCALLHLKPVVKECDKIADEYIPELIDTLASEMNPQVVCSVAGLCNNERIHKMLEESGEIIVPSVKKPNSCEGCHTVVGLVEDKFHKMSRDEVLQSLLEVCGNFGSFSDGCSNIMVTYFTEVYQHLQENLNSNEICLLSGECSAQFHTHANVEITPMSHIGYVPVDESKDDLPCELCEQLVTHLRDLLISNTTEDEFKMVLSGLCKQTKEFSQECLSLVDQYYSEAYSFLVNELNSTIVCDMIGICKNPNKQVILMQHHLSFLPLLPVETVDDALRITPATKKPLSRVSLQKDTTSIKIISPLEEKQLREQQLPIDLLVPPHTQVLYNTEVCVFCEYFLHYIQQVITNKKSEDEIKEVIDKACSKLPSSISDTCIDFVDTYEPALVAILAQEIDPSQVCPRIKACPSAHSKDVEVFMQAKGGSQCPLCLFAVTKLEDMVKDKKSEENIKSALNKLCVHLPSDDLAEECEDFVTTYTNELVEMLIADLKPDEVCVYLKLCTDDKPAGAASSNIDSSVFVGDTETNNIPDNTVDGKLVDKLNVAMTSKPQCVLCEFVMKEIEDQLKDKKTDDEIKNVVYDICNVMPGSIKTECNAFVKQYADTVIQLLIAALEPSDICSYMKLCTDQFDSMRGEILDCPICHMTVEAMDKILNNPKVVHDLEHVLEKTCRGIPKQYRNKCTNLLKNYGDILVKLLQSEIKKDVICPFIGMCKSEVQQIVID